MTYALLKKLNAANIFAEMVNWLKKKTTNQIKAEEPVEQHVFVDPQAKQIVGIFRNVLSFAWFSRKIVIQFTFCHFAIV